MLCSNLKYAIFANDASEWPKQKRIFAKEEEERNETIYNKNIDSIIKASAKLRTFWNVQLSENMI